MFDVVQPMEERWVPYAAILGNHDGDAKVPRWVVYIRPISCPLQVSSTSPHLILQYEPRTAGAITSHWCRKLRTAAVLGRCSGIAGILYGQVGTAYYSILAYTFVVALGSEGTILQNMHLV